MIQNISITDGPMTASSGCACCSPADKAPSSQATSSQAHTSSALQPPAPTAHGVQASYAVTGMTCGHCVSAVRAELSALPGVSTVTVDLVAGATSTVTITSTAPLEDAAVTAAVEEAGYTVSDSSPDSSPDSSSDSLDRRQ